MITCDKCLAMYHVSCIVGLEDQNILNDVIIAGKSRNIRFKCGVYCDEEELSIKVAREKLFLSIQYQFGSNLNLMKLYF